MSNWIELDQQWRQRSEELFKRCLREPDIAKAQRAWSAACEAEAKRLEWKSLCLQQEEDFGAAAIVDNARTLFSPYSCDNYNHFSQSFGSSC